MLKFYQCIMFSVKNIKNNIVLYDAYILMTFDIKITEIKTYIQSATSYQKNQIKGKTTY